ncbi:transcriptional regulator, partial [Escherichia coli]
MSCRVNSSPVSILVGEDVYTAIFIRAIPGNDSNLLIVFYVQIMPDDFV